MKKIIMFILLSVSIFSSYEIKNNNVYYNGELVKNTDAKSFIILDDNYGKDKSHVYFISMKLEDVDPLSFESLSSNYGKDKNNVYFQLYKVEDADIYSFVSLGSYYGKDKNNIYYHGETLGLTASLDKFHHKRDVYLGLYKLAEIVAQVFNIKQHF